MSRTGILGAILLALSTPSWAKPPTLTNLFPAGASRGQTVEVTAGGSFDPWPVRVRVEGRGVTFTPAEKAGTFTVTVAPDAPVGVAWVRLYNDEGAGALRPFLVGPTPEVQEAEPNDDPTAAQPVEGPSVTVNGRLAKSGDVDGFAVTLDKGQTLVAALTAHETLGSPMDGTLQVATPDGFVLDHADDVHGLDPRLVFVAPAAGTYVVRAFAFPAEPSSAIRYAGGADYIYRLTLTTGAFADHAYPLAVSRDDPGSVDLSGWNLPDDARTRDVRPEADGDAVRIEHPALANAVEVSVVPYGSSIEQEPSTPDEPQAITLPIALTGRIDPQGDRDAYRFEAKKGEKRLFRAVSRSLGFPLDPVLRVLDASGKVVAEADDVDRTHRDAELLFTAPQDGAYRVVVRDLNGRGGPRFVYRLDALIPEPDFRLSVKSDRFTLTPGQPLEIPVAVERRNGYDGAIAIAPAPGELPEGIQAAPATSEPKGGSSKTVTLKLTGPGAEGWSGPFRVVGRPVAESGAGHTAEFALDGLDATTERGWLTVLPPKKPDGDDGEKDGKK